MLGPGEMVEVDTKADRVHWNEEIRMRYAKEKPYGDWIREEKSKLKTSKRPRRVSQVKILKSPLRTYGKTGVSLG